MFHVSHILLYQLISNTNHSSDQIIGFISCSLHSSYKFTAQYIEKKSVIAIAVKPNSLALVTIWAGVPMASKKEYVLCPCIRSERQIGILYSSFPLQKWSG